MEENNEDASIINVNPMVQAEAESESDPEEVTNEESDANDDQKEPDVAEEASVAPASAAEEPAMAMGQTQQHPIRLSGLTPLR